MVTRINIIILVIRALLVTCREIKISKVAFFPIIILTKMVIIIKMGTIILTIRIISGVPTMATKHPSQFVNIVTKLDILQKSAKQ